MEIGGEMTSDQKRPLRIIDLSETLKSGGRELQATEITYRDHGDGADAHRFPASNRERDDARERAGGVWAGDPLLSLNRIAPGRPWSGA